VSSPSLPWTTTPECCPVLGKKIDHVKVLTGEARRVIASAHCHGVHGGRLDAREPPYMAPSEDPEGYSAVRNFLTSAPAHLTPPLVVFSVQ